MKRLILSFAALALLMSGAGQVNAAVVYDNGPINGTVKAWTINFGYQVTDSFTVSSPTTLTGAQIGLWVYPGGSPTSVEWSIGSAPYGSNISSETGAGLTNVFQYNNSFGYDVLESTFSLTGVLSTARTGSHSRTRCLPMAIPLTGIRITVRHQRKKTLRARFHLSPSSFTPMVLFRTLHRHPAWHRCGGLGRLHIATSQVDDRVRPPIDRIHRKGVSWPVPIEDPGRRPPKPLLEVSEQNRWRTTRRRVSDRDLPTLAGPHPDRLDRLEANLVAVGSRVVADAVPTAADRRASQRHEDRCG